MAEFLIYEGPHWMDKLRPADLEDRLKDPYFKHKYDARYQPGDLVQAYPDGALTERPAPNSMFTFLRVPGMSFRDAEALIVEGDEVLDPAILDRDGNAKPFLEFRRKHSVDTSGLTISDGERSTDETDLNARLITKARTNGTR